MRVNGVRDALGFYPNIDGFWDSGDLLSTEHQILSKLPAQWETQAGSDSAELLTQLAHVQALLGRIPEALVTLEQAHKLILSSDAPPRTKLRWTLEQGRCLCLAMNPSKAHDLFAQAWTMANENQEPFFAIDAALMLSTVRPPKFQNEWLKRALTIAEQTPDENAKKWLAHLLFLDGWHAFDFRQFESALESFNKALLRHEFANDDKRSYALSWSRARVLRALDRTAEALTIQQALFSKMSSTGDVDGHVYLELAECKQLMKQQEDAKGYFELAYAALSKVDWYSNNRTDELERMKYLSKKR